MSAANKEESILHDDIKLVYDMTEKPTFTNSKSHQDRAVVTNLRADLLLSSDKRLTVDIDFDTTSGYHNNAIMIMNDFGVEMLAIAFETKYGKEHAEQLPKIFAVCGEKEHDDKDSNFKSII